MNRRQSALSERWATNFMKERIGVVGVGRMGANMARRLKECGGTITVVHDAQPKAAKTLAAELGCVATRSLPTVTSLADMVVTVVSDDAAMELIFAERGPSLLRGAAGRLFVNCATVTPSVHRAIEARARAAGAQSLEACMASSITQARQGSLYLMCAGERAAYDRALPFLQWLGGSLRYLGAAGEAAKVKALVNMVMNINTAGLAEGLALGEALGLDLGVLREVFAETGASSRVLQTDGEDMQRRDHTCFFSAAHAAKDSGIALDLGRECRLKLPLATAAKRQFDRMVELGLGHLDKSGVAELTFRSRGPRPTK